MSSLALCVDLADAQLGVDGQAGGVRAAVVEAPSDLVDAALLLSEEGDRTRAADLAVDLDVHLVGDDQVDLTGAALDADVPPVERLDVVDLAQVQVELAGAEVVGALDLGRAVGRLADPVTLPLAGGGDGDHGDGGEQAKQDQTARPAVDRADQQHEPGDADGE